MGFQRWTDSFLAFASAGVVLPISANDIKVMDALGWDVRSVSTPMPDLIVDSVTAPASVAQGATLDFSYVVKNQGCRKTAISEATFCNWRHNMGEMTPSEMKRLRQLEEENGKLKKLVADLSLDKSMRGV